MIRLKYIGILLFSISFISTHVKSEPENKEIVTKCLENSIEIQLIRNESFSGSIYIEGYEEKDTCKQNYKDVKKPILAVLHELCAPKKKNIVNVTAVIKPYSGSTIVRNIECDYNKKVHAKTDFQIHPKPIKDIKHNLHQNIMELWKAINDVMCDCNLKSYIDKIKSFVRPSE